MGEKIYTFGDRHASIIEFVFLPIRSENQKYIYEVAHKKMECHNLQTFHWHYKAYVHVLYVVIILISTIRSIYITVH